MPLLNTGLGSISYTGFEKLMTNFLIPTEPSSLPSKPPTSKSPASLSPASLSPVSQSSPTTSASNALGAGAIAGIVIGAVVFCFLLALIGYLLLKHSVVAGGADAKAPVDVQMTSNDSYAKVGADESVPTD